nr:hypothetical protein [Tanacetum cinerariifolium]
MDSKKNIVDLETFRDMLPISPRVSGQSFEELPFEEDILDFLRFLGHSAQIKTLTDVISSANLVGAISQKKHRLCISDMGRFYVSSGTQESKEEQRDVLPKASARRKRNDSDTSITPPTTILTPITTVDVALRLTTNAKGKQPAKAKSPSDPSELARTEAQQLKIVIKRSRQETHISQHGGSSTNEGTGSKPGVPDVP